MRRASRELFDLPPPAVDDDESAPSDIDLRNGPAPMVPAPPTELPTPDMLSPREDGSHPVRRMVSAAERPSRFFNFLKWLYPGMGVKRWFFLIILGTMIVAAGVDVLLLPQWLTVGNVIGEFLLD